SRRIKRSKWSSAKARSSMAWGRPLLAYRPPSGGERPGCFIYNGGILAGDRLVVRILALLVLAAGLGALAWVLAVQLFPPAQQVPTMPDPVAVLILTQEQASAFARLALKGIQCEYPNHPGHVVNDAADVKHPRELHPAFYGCFDWHSSVHG